MSASRAGSARSQSPEAPEQRGVAAVETAAAILEVLHSSSTPLGVTAIAQASGISPARAHHYLVSLTRIGLARKDGPPSRYGLGPYATRLGLTAVDRLEVQHFCAPFLHRISAETQEASFFSVWSQVGPVIVRWEQGSRPLTVFARLGTVMPLLRSATGDIYSAWGPQPGVRDAVEKALLRMPPQQRAAEREALHRRATQARQSGCGVTRGSMLPDVSAVAAPVFGKSGALEGAITALGLLRAFDASPTGATARCVREESAALSEKLGFERLRFAPGHPNG